MLTFREALRVRHESKDAATGVLEAGDPCGAAIDIGSVDQWSEALFYIALSVAVISHKAAFRMGYRQLKLLRQPGEIGAG
jgi:hypothetical protein